MKTILSKILNFFFSFLKIDNNKIIFESGRNKVDDNPLAIYQYMKTNHLDSKYKLIYLVSKNTDISTLDKNDVFYYKTIRGYYHQATAKFWIRSQGLGGLIKKRKGQICIYPDHGILGLKKIAYDAEGAKERPQKEYTKIWDYYVAANEFTSKQNAIATGYKGKSVVLGLARTDKLVNIDNEKVKKIKKDLGLLHNKKTVVLYAPTFRQKDIENNIPSYPIEKLMQLTNIKLIVTVHPLAKDVMKKIKLSNNVIDAIDYEINDLLLVSDILITDYSSVMFDFLLLNKPIIYYPYDYEEYVKIRNGFYIDYKKDLPGPIAYNEEQLINILNDIKSLDNYKKKIIEFNKKTNYMNDGDVCKRIVEQLIENINQKG